MHKAIICSQIPVQGTPHPHARVFKNFVFTSAIAPLSVGSVLPPVGFQAQAQLVMEHLKEILRQAKTEPSRVFKLTVLLSDMRYLDGFYEVWQHAFPGCFPVISVYAVPALQGVYDLEIDAMALSRDSSWTISPIRTANAHRTRGAFPQGVKVGDYIFTASMMPLNPSTGKPVEEFDEQVRTAMRNALAVVEAGGASMSQVLTCICPLTNMKLFDQFNSIYTEFFQSGNNPPARSCFGASGLEGISQITAECYGYLGDDKEELVSPIAPQLGYPFCHGMRAGELYILSGQIGYDSRRKLTPEPYDEQLRVVLENLISCVEAGGGTAEDVVRCHNYLTHIGQMELFNGVYKEFFKPDYPACATYQVNGLAHQFIVEITAIACVSR